MKQCDRAHFIKSKWNHIKMRPRVVHNPYKVTESCVQPIQSYRTVVVRKAFENNPCQLIAA